MRLNEKQLKEIEKGIASGVDISIYATEGFDAGQMYEIRVGLEKGLEVSKYALRVFKKDEMCEIRQGLEDGLDVSSYARPGVGWKRMYTLRWLLMRKRERNNVQ